jgi:hypothetical protein
MRWRVISAVSTGGRLSSPPLGKALAGGSRWVLLTWSPRDGELHNQWASDHTHSIAALIAEDGQVIRRQAVEEEDDHD